MAPSTLQAAPVTPVGPYATAGRHTPRAMRRWGAAWGLVLVAAAGHSSAAGGLTTPEVGQVWPQWSTGRTAELPSSAGFSLLDRPELAAGLLGNHYFNTPGLRLPAAWAASSGLRATSGLLTARRPLAGGGLGTDAQPYLGLGYTGLALNGGWGFSADLGLALDEGVTRLGRAVFGSSSLDSAMRELRFSPVLQLGVRYAF